MSGLHKETRTDPVAGSSTMIEPTLMVQSQEYFSTDQPTTAWTGTSACSQLCRMCATENEYLIPIFDGEGVEHQLGMKIEKHLPIRVHVEDTLPLHVCYQCASTLIAWHDLVAGCIEAEKKLIQIQTHGRAEAQVEEVDVKSADSALFFPEQMDTESSAEPSTSGNLNVPTRQTPKKTVPKANPKLKMVIVKTPAAPAAGAATSRVVVPKSEAIPDTAERCGLAAVESASSVNYSQLTLIVECVCSHCGRAFSLRNELAEHLVSEHGVSIFHCGDCGKLVEGSKERFVKHAKRHLQAESVPGRAFPCGDCGKEFPRKCDVVRHVTRAHAPRRHSCPTCTATFTEESELESHRKTHEAFSLLPAVGGEGFPCPVCPKVLSRKHDLKRHVFYSHKSEWPGLSVSRSPGKAPEKTSVCPICGRLFSRKYDMVRHLKRHPELEQSEHLLEQCLGPTASTARPSPRAREKDALCPVCGREFTRKWDMVRHLKVHPEFDRSLFERPGDDSLEQYFARKADHSFFRKAKPKPRENVPCPVCGHVFSRRYDMNRHLKVHPEYDPSTAPTATAPIVSVPSPQPMAHANLIGGLEVDESRIVSADGQAYFRCRHCGQDFTQRYIFARHLRMHSERPFTCHVCGLEWPQSLLPTGRPPNALLSCSACSLIVSSRFPSANN